MDIVAEKLKALRLEQGLSQELLAKQSGLSLRTIQRLEREGGGSAETLLSLSAAFNIAPNKLRNDNTLPLSTWSLATSGYRIITISLLLLIMASIIIIASQGQILIYVDMISAIFLMGFISLSTLLATGFTGFKQSLYGLRFIFSNQLFGRTSIINLANLYRFQYRLCYSAAFLCTLLGLISLFYYESTLMQNLLPSGVSVLMVIWLYAAILAEVILRPLIFKLSRAINQQNKDDT